MKIKPLIPVGSMIKVEKSKINNVLPKKILDELPQIINGEVIDYKMTDGMDIGYVLVTDNNLKIWIFNNELNEQTKKEYEIEDSNRSTNLITKELLSQINKVKYELSGNRSIKKIANPFNLISWLIFTLKDIF
jgi:ribosome-binding factor A